MNEKDLTTDMLEAFRNILETIEGKTIKRESAEYNFIIEDCEKSIYKIEKYLQISENIVTIELIRRQVCKFYRIKVCELNELDRTKKIMNARQVSMYLSRTLINKTLIEIASKFNRGHATVLHAINKVRDLIEFDKELNIEIQRITKLIEYETR